MAELITYYKLNSTTTLDSWAC